jgi:uncharacterized membrane protein YhaH (DUF805 family)
MGFGEAIRACFGKYAVFNGRARRSEYWYFVLFGIIVSMVTNTADAIITGASSGAVPAPVSGIASLALLLPQLSVNVRRLHDTNRSGWWIGGFYLYLIGAVIAGVAYFVVSGSSSFDDGPAIAGMVILGLGAFAYGVLLIVFTVLPGTHGTNRFGPDPKAPDVDVF